jgi:hypothetical protein
MKYLTTAQMHRYLYDVQTRGSITGTSSINHDECGDKRNRLYITPTSDDKFLFYCHNCGTRGCLIDQDLPNIRNRYLEKDADYPLGVVEFTARYWPMLTMCNDMVVFHLARYLGISTSTDVPQLAFKLSGGKCFIECGGKFEDIRPCMDFYTGPAHGILDDVPTTITEYKFAGMQRWRWEDGNPVKRSAGKMSPALFYNVDTGVGDNLLVICEDPVSAMCVVESGSDALCLFGTNITNHSLCDYSIMYNHVLVWLDLDSDENRALSVNYTRVCQLVSDHAVSFRNHLDATQLRYTKHGSKGFIKHDPKNYKPEYVRTVFDIVKSKVKSV